MALNKVDIVVIGAGPAGMAGALEAARQGLSVILLDENSTPGGQIYRNVQDPPPELLSVLGPDYLLGRNLTEAINRKKLDIRCGASVWQITPDRQVYFTKDGAAEEISAQAILLATGAIERPFPIRGWTLPGVMTAGAAQIAMKTDGMVPDGRLVLAGSGPLLYLVANQLCRAGANIAALLDTTPTRNYVRAIRYFPNALRGFGDLFKGFGLLRDLAKLPFPVIRGVTDLSVTGIDHATAVDYRAGRRFGAVEADGVLLHHGVIPNIQLPHSIGCDITWSDTQACFIPKTSASGETSVPGIYVAGDGGGILGARAAELAARIAVTQIVHQIKGRLVADDTKQLSRRLARHTAIRPLIDMLYLPPPSLRIPSDPDIVVCRCEEVTSGQIDEAVKLGCPGPNQLKFFSRCGMGACQGRNCGLTTTEILARATGEVPNQVGYFRIRPPILPVKLGEIAGMDVDEQIADIEFS